MPKPRRSFVLIAGAAATGLLAVASLSSTDVVLHNGTPSMPVGFYLRSLGAIERGAIVTVRALEVTPAYAADRDFTDRGDRFIKRVAAVAGDQVCASGAEITLNGSLVALRQRQDASGGV
jgi:type IV secretory pathway protease TraF